MTLDRSELYKRSFNTDDVLIRHLQAVPGLLVGDDLIAAGAGLWRCRRLESPWWFGLHESDLAAAFPILLGGKLIGFIGLRQGRQISFLSGGPDDLVVPRGKSRTRDRAGLYPV